MEKNKTEKKRIIKDGTLGLAGSEMYCCVLDDGTRGFSIRNSQEVLGITNKDNKQNWSANRLGEFLGQKSLQPFLHKEKGVGNFDLITCYDKNGVETHILEAPRLIDIADCILEARKSGKLGKRKDIVAKQCEIIIRSVAKVGIIALIDEATGYQYEREKDALQKQLDRILGLYVLDKPQRWERIFPWTFYREIFRLYNMDFILENISRPPFIGTLTNKYIYQNLPNGVLEKLKKETPKGKSGNYKHNLHRLLTTEVGREDLKKTIYSIEALLAVSENMEEFKKLEAKYRKQKELLYVDLNLVVKDEKEQIKEDFDKKFDALLNVPSPKKSK